MRKLERTIGNTRRGSSIKLYPVCGEIDIRQVETACVCTEYLAAVSLVNPAQIRNCLRKRKLSA